MARLKWMLAGTLVASFVCGASAQGRPDFSGQWTIDAGAVPAETTPAVGSMGSGWGSAITIEQGANQLTVEYAFFVRGDLQPPLKFTYALDGSETLNTVQMGRGMQTQKSTTTWQGESLVITTVHPFSDPASGQAMTVDVRQRLTVELPASLIVETTRSGVLGGAASTVRTLYRKG